MKTIGTYTLSFEGVSNDERDVKNRLREMAAAITKEWGTWYKLVSASAVVIIKPEPQDKIFEYTAKELLG